MKKTKIKRPTGVPDKEVSILRNRIRCSLCGNKYNDIVVTWREGSVWSWHLCYKGSLGQLEPCADAWVYRNYRLMKDPISYKKMVGRRRLTIEKGMLNSHPLYHRATVKLTCKCGGWRCVDLKAKLNPASYMRFERPFWGI